MLWPPQLQLLVLWSSPLIWLRSAEAAEGERFRRAFQPYASGQAMARQMSGLLDKLLDPHRYNKRLRPGLGVEEPVDIEINLSITGMGPVDENTQSFFLDCYFRQSWRDDRLAFNVTGMTELPLDWQILSLIWKPDTYFVNGMRSKMHKMTVPNRFSRISPDGRVSYSQRLTVHARCAMDLHRYPLDSQVCPLLIGSYAYESKDIIYKWKASPMSMDELGLAQFTLVSWDSGVNNSQSKRKTESGFRTDSVAFLRFFFERQTGFFLLQIYTTLFLVVMCSWVSFWIVRADSAARCALGITTVLSVTTIGFTGKGIKPQVPYATALDIFVIICFFTIFGVLVEYAIINFIGAFIKRYKAREELLKTAAESNGKAAVKTKARTVNWTTKIKMMRASRQQNDIGASPGDCGLRRRANCAPMASIEVDFIDEDSSVSSSQMANNISPSSAGASIPNNVSSSHSTPAPVKEATALRLWRKVSFHVAMALTRLLSLVWPKPIHQMKIYTDTEEAQQDIDDFAKVAFPATFFFLIMIYTYAYAF